MPRGARGAPLERGVAASRRRATVDPRATPRDCDGADARPAPARTSARTRPSRVRVLRVARRAPASACRPARSRTAWRSPQWPGRLERAPLRGRPRAAARRGAQPGRRGGARVLPADAVGGARGRSSSRRCATRTSTGCSRALLPAVGRLIVTRASNARSADPARARGSGARDRAGAADRDRAVARRDALDAAWRASPRIVVAGSIFLLGDVMKRARRVVIPFETPASVSGCRICSERVLVAARCVAACARARRRAHGRRRPAGRPTPPSATAAKARATRTTGSFIGARRAASRRRHEDLRRRGRVLHRREPRGRDRQRRLRAGRQPDLRPSAPSSTPKTRPRHLLQRDRHRDACSRRAAGRRAPAPSRRRRSPARRPSSYFFGETDREARTEEIQDHERRLHDLRAADAALGSARRHGRS